MPAAEVTGPEELLLGLLLGLVLGLVAAEATGRPRRRPVPAAEVTGPVTSTVPAAEVTGPEELVLGLVAEVLVPEPVTGLVAAEVTGPVAEAAADVTGAAAGVLVPDPVLGPVTAEVTVPEPTGGVVAACACRENTSKTARIPAATIATCTARRAMCRKIGCGMSSSRTNGTDQTRLVVPIISDPKHAGALYFRPISLWSPATGHVRSVHECTYCSVTTVQYGLRPEQGGWRDGRLSSSRSPPRRRQ